jgi:hypothetical protein
MIKCRIAPTGEEKLKVTISAQSIATSQIQITGEGKSWLMGE